MIDKLKIEKVFGKVKYFSCGIIGKRRSGKTYLTMKILNEIHSNFDKIYYFSGSPQMEVEKELSKYDNISFVDFCPRKLEKLLDAIATIRKENGSLDLLLIFDDCLAKLTTKNEDKKLFDKIFLNGRHYHISTIFLSQVENQNFYKSVRQNMDILILAKSENKKMLMNVWEEQLSLKIDKNEFLKHIVSLNKKKKFWYLVSTNKKVGRL